METLQLLVEGILTAASPLNLLYGFVGVLLGTLVGVLPGLGPAGAIALLLPLALHAPPLAYLIMLFGITYGAQYGGSTTSILVNIPGEASSVVTCLDGYAMARQGRASRRSASPPSDLSSAARLGSLAWRSWRRPLLNWGFALARRSMPRCSCSV